MKGRAPLSRIIIIGAFAESLVNFRGDLIKSLVAAGHEVLTMAGHPNDATRERIEALGVTFKTYQVQRSGMNPFSDLMTFVDLRAAIYEFKPDILLAYTIKPIIWGGLAMRSLGMAARFYALITGLGLVFQPGGYKHMALMGLVSRLYRWSLVKAQKVIFQNHDNRQYFVDHQIVDAKSCVVVSGSGVNLEHFTVTPLPQGNVVFLSIARLLVDKGLREYSKAAQIVKEKYPNATFYLVGPTDPSPNRISLSEVQSWQESGAVNYLGETRDVRPFIEQCHAYVLPSYHEGMPRTVMEAMAMGRPIITTDVPGCRETVVDGDNGFLVPVKNVQALADAMEQLINHPELVKKMGRRSREIVEERFDVNKVNNEILKAMCLI
jgi:glycosyltransferase involved in cell wall biosynthesis